MRHKISLLTLALLLIVLGFLPVLLPATVAQEGTATPDGNLTPIPANTPSDEPVVVRLPFGDTFDTNWGWIPSGTWRFETQTAYSGGGWYLDGGPRELRSILEYQSLIDLSGALSAQLVYRQKGVLPPSDLIAVDLSLDGGLSWYPIDQQIGINQDWNLYIVDLTSYRGQVIRLRFRVNTGAAMSENELTPVGYWIDNLTIQYVLFPPPEMVSQPGPQYSTTLMGLHLVLWAPTDTVLSLVKLLRENKHPLGTIKGTTGTEETLRAVAEISPETVIVYRSLLGPDGQQRDCPNVYHDPVIEAQAWLAGLQQYWQNVPADYYEPINECQFPIDWLVAFSLEAMRVANERGQCLLLFSFAVGNPTPDVYQQLIPVYQYALDHPCQSGRYHGIALHAYGLTGSRLVSESGIWLGYRHRLYYERILNVLPEAIKIPVYITEAGQGTDTPNPHTCQDIMRDVIQYTQQLEFDPYIKGFHLWTMGGGGQTWLDVSPCIPLIGQALLTYYAGR